MNKELFVKDLSALINSHSAENCSNTPDFILASYLLACMEIFNSTVNIREKWYGREYSGSAAPATSTPT